MKCRQIVLVFCILLGSFKLHGQESLYDNLNALDPWVPPNIGYTTVLGPDVRFAQQFLTGDNTDVNSVTVQLIRTGEGVTGNLAFELWHDNGADDPLLPTESDVKIADLGTIDDVSNIPQVRTDYTFNNLDLQLEPDEEYWVVANFQGISGSLSNSSVGWAHTIWPPPPFVPEPPQPYKDTLGTLGTNGASSGHAIKQPYGKWDELGPVAYGADWVYFLMSVTSCSEPPPGDYDGDCFLNVADVDLLTAEIAAGRPYDPLFDLSGDGAVDDADLTKWLSDAGTYNGFVDAFLPGDSNLDGSVDAIDLNSLALNWGQSVAEWSGGDFSVSGAVDSADLNALALNWRKSIAMASSASAPVPEPSAWPFALVGLAIAWRQRRLG